METDFNPQESEFQETDNQLNQEEGQSDGTGSWDEETIDQDPLEDQEEPDTEGSSDAGEEGSNWSDDSSGEEDEDDPENISGDDEDEDDDNFETDDEKNTLDGNSNRVLSFEDYFRN